MLTAIAETFQKISNLGLKGKTALSQDVLGKQIRLVNIFSIVTFFFGLLSLPFDWFTAPRWMVIEDLVSMTCCFAPPILNHFGKYRTSRAFFLIMGNVMITMNCILMGEQAGIHNFLVVLSAFGVTLFNLREKRWMFFCAIIPLLEFWFVQAYGFDLYVSPLSPAEGHVYYLYVIVATFAFVCTCIVFLQHTNRQSEAQLQETRAHAILSEKMAALGEMSSGMAHEINTPLMGLQINTSLLKRYLKDKENHVDKIEQLVKKSDELIGRITRITRSLQAFTKPALQTPLADTSLRKIVDQTLDLCQERFRDSLIQLNVVPIPAFLEVRCRSSQVSQALYQLLANAYTAVQAKERKQITLLTRWENSRIQLVVRDNGAGVPVEIRDKIFLPFFTTRESGKGSGLGLSVSKEMIESQGGTLFLNPNSEQTEFVIELPTSADPPVFHGQEKST